MYGSADELAGDDLFERVDARVVDPLVEELHVFGALRQHVAEDALEKRLGQVHVVGQLEERHLRLDHPELGQVPRGVGVLGAKRRAEGVDLAQRAGEDFGFKLSADGEERRAVEEVLGEVDVAQSGFASGQLVELERGDLEHLARAFAVAGGDDRRVDVEKAVLLKELVDRAADLVAHAGNCAKRVGARAEVGDRAQELEGVPLLLKRIGFGVGQPWTMTRLACTSVACPLAGDSLTSPSTVTLQPAVRCLISLS